MTPRLILLFLLCAFTASAQMTLVGQATLNGQVATAVGGGAEQTCSSTPNVLIADTATTTDNMGQRLQWMAGNYPWTNGTSQSICRVDVKLKWKAGDITTNTYNAVIREYTDATHCGSVLGTSSGVLGTNTWDATWVAFSFSPAIAITGGTPYALLCGPSAENDSSYVAIYYKADVTNRYVTTYPPNGVSSQQANGYGVAMKVYWMQ